MRVLKILVWLIYRNFLDVKFYNSGLGGFEVTDDGCGVKESDFEIIAKRGTTSKLQQYD